MKTSLQNLFEDLESRISDISELLEILKEDIQYMRKFTRGKNSYQSVYDRASGRQLSASQMYIELIKTYTQLQNTAISSRFQQIKLLKDLESNEQEEISIDPTILTKLQQEILVVKSGGTDNGEKAD